MGIDERTEPDPFDDPAAWPESQPRIWWLEIQSYNMALSKHSYGMIVSPTNERHRVEQVVETKPVAADLELEMGDVTERFGHEAVLVARAIELFEELARPGDELFLAGRAVRLSTPDPHGVIPRLWTARSPV